MQLPEFTDWTPWTGRETIQNVKRPGVYVLARFETPPSGPADVLDPSVVYVGETCDQVLRERWNQFGRSAFSLKGGHSGGKNFAATFMEGRAGDPPGWLYLSACPVNLDLPHRSAYIRYLERWLIWEYVQKHGRLPVCNKK